MNRLELRKVRKAFGGVQAVSVDYLKFRDHSITVLVGPNGAGKTTVFHLICGALRPDSGEILLDNRSLVGLHPWQISKLGVGRLFQDVRLFARMTVIDNLLVSFPDNDGDGPFRSSLSDPWRRLSENRHKKRAAELLQLLELEGMEDRLAESLSYGQQKLLAIGRLIAAQSQVLLLDEPTAGLNPTMTERVLRLLRDLATQGKIVAVIEHNMNVVLRIADWVCFLDKGEVELFGLPSEVLGDRDVRASYMGL
jgi:ABC-type branched-subunit amino acid transport system ATPase component